MFQERPITSAPAVAAGQAQPTPATVPRARFNRCRQFTTRASWTYLVSIALLWCLLRVASDRWWPATVLLFSPRWCLLVPMVPLVFSAIVLRCRVTLPLPLTGIIIIGPVMDLCVPWRAWLITDQHRRVDLRVLTLNVHHAALTPALLANYIEQVKPDIVVLQEWLPSNRVGVFRDDRWHFIGTGDQFLASRWPADMTRDLTPEWGANTGEAVQYTIHTPSGPIPFLNVHFNSPHFPLSALLHGRRIGPSWLASSSVERWKEAVVIGRLATGLGGKTIIAGDFNLPCDSSAYTANLSNFADAFSTAGLGFGWTYRAHWTLTRIDHILSGAEWDCIRCRIGPDVGSPHRPVLAEYHSPSSRQ